MKYYFSDFIYDTEQSKLTINGKTIEMTKKCHQLLLFLLKNSQRLISRDELIDNVWNKRVVTSNTIDQTILKLRTALDKAKSGKYIESVYGQGVRFMVKTSTQVKIKNTKKRVNIDKKIYTLLFLSVAIPFLFYFYHTHKQASKTADNTIDVLLKYDKNHDMLDKQNWLIYGSGNYLSYLLNQNPDLQVIREYKDQQIGTQSRLNILELSNNTGENTKIKIKFNPISNNTYQAELIAILPENKTKNHTITTNSISQLMLEINNWIVTDIFSDSKPYKIQQNVFSNDEYALQSFFRGMQSLMLGNAHQAITYLQTAVKQDPKFSYAWYQLAVAYRNQGDRKKALSILKSIKTTDSYLRFHITLVMAQCYDLLQQFEIAEKTYNQAYAQAQQLHHIGKQAAVLISQAIFYRKLAKFKKARHALEQALAITNAELQPYLYGTLMNSYAKLEREQQNYESAIDKAKKAIAAFNKAKDYRYEAQAKTALTSILLIRNKLQQAKKWISEALFHAEQVNNLRGISDNKTKLAMIYQKTGQFQLAIENWNDVLELTNKLELFGNKTQAHLWLVKLYLHHKDMENAKIHLKHTQQIYREVPRDSIKSLMLEAEILVDLVEENTSNLPELLSQLEKIDSLKCILYRGDFALLQKKYQAAEMHYQKFQQHYDGSGNFQILSMIANRLSRLYIATDSEKLIQNINKTETYKPLVYPFLKYKALAELLKNDKIEAMSIMQECKSKSNDLWTDKDEQLLISL